MVRRSTALFRAVVLLGAELTACSKAEPSPPKALEPGQPSARADASVNVPSALETATEPTASNTPPGSTASNTPPTPAVSNPPAASAPLALAPSLAPPKASALPVATPRVSSALSKQKPCPPNSEMPFPPCYFIL